MCVCVYFDARLTPDNEFYVLNEDWCERAVAFDYNEETIFYLLLMNLLQCLYSY